MERSSGGRNRDLCLIEGSAHNLSVSSVPDPPLSLADAEGRFCDFLRSEGYPTSICWVFAENVLIDTQRRHWIRPDRVAGQQRAALEYSAGLERGLGIWLRAICSTEVETFASVYVPIDNIDAHYRLIGRGLKLSCPMQKTSTFITRNPLRWLVLRLANAERSKWLWV